MEKMKASNVAATTTPDRFTVTVASCPGDVFVGWLVEWYWENGRKCGRISVQDSQLNWLEVWFYENDIRW